MGEEPFDQVPPTRLRGFAPVATHVVNPVMGHVAGWAPGMAVVTHKGRKSGRIYQTPVNVFQREHQFWFVLTYGQSQWVKNVLAAGECQMRFQRRDVHLVNPEVVVDPAMTSLPWPVRLVGRAVRVSELLKMSAAEDKA